MRCPECGADITRRALKATNVGERKQVTVLFSDLAGYTSMSEKLDPEELKDIMGRLFGEVAQTVTRYEGHIEKFIGDAAMVVFGVPRIHEDDAVRAVKAALEIHDRVASLGRQLGDRVPIPLNMHTGIATGLTVVGGAEPGRQQDAILGDTINLASRLTTLAKSGEVLASQAVYRQTQRLFEFDALAPVMVKGKSEPVQAYRVVAQREEPVDVHRMSGLRAAFVGRERELSQLEAAAAALEKGRGSIVAVSGDAGTGKSRLVEEFKATLDPQAVQIREGCCYAYLQNTPYAPLVDLISRAWQIREGDSPDKIRETIESNIRLLLGKTGEVAPYIGSLYGIEYPGAGQVDPEFWKASVFQAMKAVLGAMTEMGPTVIVVRDIHWADPSSIELLRSVLLESRPAVLFVCVFRPPFSLFSEDERRGVGWAYKEIRLSNLPPAEAEEMMESVLGGRSAPSDLRRFVQEKVEGNPFGLEEVINSLIERGILVSTDQTWELTRAISEDDVPVTVQGVMSARLDRLDAETKRLVQEASVIGKVFHHDVLAMITRHGDLLDRSLAELEELDLVELRVSRPRREYAFRQTLTQEVAYNSLLRAERRELHERTARAMEELLCDRLYDSYEVLAWHFKQGTSVDKAIEYLMKSGEKALRRYALEESHLAYREAFDLLVGKTERTREEDVLLIDLLDMWSTVFYYRGDFRELEDILTAYEDVARALEDKVRQGMFYVRLWMVNSEREKLEECYRCSARALELGDECGDKRLVGYACTAISYNCTDIGRLEDALAFATRAQEMSAAVPSDQHLFHDSLNSLGTIYFAMGERRRTLEAGKALLDFGWKHSNLRSLASGHHIVGHSYFMDGDYEQAIESYRSAMDVSADPFYKQFPALFLGLSYVLTGRLEEAEEPLLRALKFSETYGVESVGTPAHGLLSALRTLRGDLSRGVKVFEDARNTYEANGQKLRQVYADYVLGRIHLGLAERSGPERVSLRFILRNLGFLAWHVPLAKREAAAYFTSAAQGAEVIGANAVLAQANLGLGLLYKAGGEKDKARQCFSMSLQCFEAGEFDNYLRKARDELASLEVQ